MISCHPPSDGDLILAAQSGDRRSFAILVRRYQDRLFRSMLFLVGCPATSEDIVQDAFVKAFVRIDQFRRESNFYSWLYRIALNSRRPYLRNAKHFQNVDDMEDLPGAKLSPSSTPHDRIEAIEARRMVQDALRRLPKQQRTILILREFDGFDYSSIANILQIEMGTVRSRLSRARRRLREELREYMDQK